MSTQKKYPGRLIHDEKFLKSLENGKLNEMLKAICEINKKKKGTLDVQIRNDYLNIYYRGSNALRVKSEKSIEFDEFYFYNEVDFKGKLDRPKKEIMEEPVIVDKLRKRRNELKKLFYAHKYEEYFAGAQVAINNWLGKKKKQERETQHRMVACQTLRGYTIIDIEFEVSINSDYHCKYTKPGAENRAKPRFDIIAVNDAGELCVIELKKGSDSLEGTSGLKEHWECFNKSVGDKTRNTDFVEETKRLLEQKQKLGLIKVGISIKGDDVKFLFAYEYKGEKHTEKEQEDTFDLEFKKISAKNRAEIKTLWLKDGSIYKQS